MCVIDIELHQRPVFRGADYNDHIAKAKAGIDESRQVEIHRFPAESERWQKVLERVLRLTGVDATGPTIRAPREVRETLARFGVVARPGNVRLPPLPPLWR